MLLSQKMESNCYFYDEEVLNLWKEVTNENSRGHHSWLHERVYNKFKNKCVDMADEERCRFIKHNIEMLSGATVKQLLTSTLFELNENLTTHLYNDLEKMGSTKGQAKVGKGWYVDKIINEKWNEFHSKIKEEHEREKSFDYERVYCLQSDIVINHFAEEELHSLAKLIVSNSYTFENSAYLFEAVFAQKVESEDIFMSLMRNYFNISKVMTEDKFTNFIHAQAVSSRGTCWMNLEKRSTELIKQVA